MKPQAGQAGLLPSAGPSEIKEVSFSGASVPKGVVATGCDQGYPAYPSGEIVADGRCVLPSRQLRPRQLNNGDSPASAPSPAATAAPPSSLDLRAASSPHHPMGARTWGGLPLTSLADASGGCVEGAGGAAALRLGLFRFKGSPETLSMVNVVPASLAGRR